MGIMILFGGIILILAVTVFLLVKYCRNNAKCQSLLVKLKTKIFWNSILRFALQSYLKNGLAVMFSIYVISFASGDTGIVNGIISLILLLVLVSLPILFAIILHRNRENLTDAAMKAKIGSLYLGMRVQTLGQRLYSSIFLTRRLLYAILTVVCINNPNILIHVFLAANILYVVYLGLTSPNDTKLGLRMEYVNESFLQLTTYHLALFPLAPTLADEELAGWSMVATIGAVFLINLCVMIVMSICGLRRKL